jgi:hypothetical protein
MINKHPECGHLVGCPATAINAVLSSPMHVECLVAVEVLLTALALITIPR